MRSSRTRIQGLVSSKSGCWRRPIFLLPQLSCVQRLLRIWPLVIFSCTVIPWMRDNGAVAARRIWSLQTWPTHPLVRPFRQPITFLQCARSLWMFDLLHFVQHASTSSCVAPAERPLSFIVKFFLWLHFNQVVWVWPVPPRKDYYNRIIGLAAIKSTRFIGECPDPFYREAVKYILGVENLVVGSFIVSKLIAPIKLS